MSGHQSDRQRGWSVRGRGLSRPACQDQGWQVGVVSGPATLFYLVSAFCLPLIGIAIAKAGPRGVIMPGAAILATGVVWIGHVEAPWEVYGAFLLMGIGWACLSTTAIATTLSP